MDVCSGVHASGQIQMYTEVKCFFLSGNLFTSNRKMSVLYEAVENSIPYIKVLKGTIIYSDENACSHCSAFFTLMPM